MVRFKDIVVKEEGDGIEDGILGASFLSNFDVEIRFGAMTLVAREPGRPQRRAARTPPPHWRSPDRMARAEERRTRRVPVALGALALWPPPRAARRRMRWKRSAN